MDHFPCTFCKAPVFRPVPGIGTNISLKDKVCASCLVQLRQELSEPANEPDNLVSMATFTFKTQS